MYLEHHLCFDVLVSCHDKDGLTVFGGDQYLFSDELTYGLLKLAMMHGFQALRSCDVDDVALDCQESWTQKIVVSLQPCVDLFQLHLFDVLKFPIREIRRTYEAALEKINNEMSDK